MSEPVEPTTQPAPSSSGGPPVFRMNGERMQGFDASTVTKFDFRNPDFVSQTDLRLLTGLHTSFTQHLSARLSTFVRMECGLKLAEFASKPFAQFTSALPETAHVTLFEISNLRGVGTLALSLPLGLAIADRLLGGKGRASTTDRSLTEIEISLLDDVVHVALKEWCGLWEGQAESLKPETIGHETGGRFLQTSAPDAVIVATELELTIGELTAKLWLGIPFPMVEGMLRKRQKTQPRATQAAPKPMQWRAPYAGIAVPISAEWKLHDMSLGEVMRFSEGQVLPLSRELVTDTRIRFANTEEFLGTAGVQNGRIAVQLTKRIQRI
jgi:flagellar motor switch protein FliM